MEVITAIGIYLLLVNILSFALMGIDKQKAKKHAFRIPEATLFLWALLGGSIGSMIGMQVFRHKTRKWYFLYGMPLILILQLVVLFLCYFVFPIDFQTM